MTHQYFTKMEQNKLPRLEKTEEALENKKVWVKLFTPWASWTWYVIEYDGEDLCWGLVDGAEAEFGYFNLNELRDVAGPNGLRVERDKWFKPCTIADVMATVKVF